MGSDNRGPFYNSAGYADPTAFHALQTISKEDSELEAKVKQLIKAIKIIAELSDMQIVNRIELRDNKTGRVFR